MAEFAITELVHLQADHFDLTCRLKEVDQVLFRGIYSDIAHPERMSIWWLDALWTVSTAGGSLGFQFWVVGHFVHVSVVDLYFDTHELFILLPHGLIDVVCVIELHMSKVTPDVAIAAANLDDFAAIFEELLELLFLWFLFHPAHPNRPAALRLLWTASPSEVVTRP